MNASELTLKLDRARWWLLSHHPFYGQLTMNLADAFGPISTACVDGKRITWGPDFLEKLTDREVRYVLLHETLHCAHQHLWRLPADLTGNIAGDYAIELILRSIPDIDQPTCGLVCPVDFETLAEEEMYSRIKSQKQQKPQDQDDSQDEQGDQEDQDDSQDEQGDQDDSQDEREGVDSCGSFARPATDVEREELSQQWESAIVQADLAVKTQHGDTPGDMKRRLEKILCQHQDWRQEIADFLKSQCAGRNDWTRSPARHAWQDVIYPRRRMDAPLILCAIDTSGSINPTLLDQFASLAEQLAQEIQCEIIRVDCDAMIHSEIRIQPGEEWSRETLGGGGTDFRPVFARAREFIDDGTPLGGIIYFTDLQGSFPLAWEDDVPTLWAYTESYPVTVPFGRVIQIRSH